MNTTLQQNKEMIDSWSLFHPISTRDTAAMVAMRAIVEPNKGRLQGTPPAFLSTESWKVWQRPVV
jgi:hypothetical protein